MPAKNGTPALVPTKTERRILLRGKAAAFAKELRKVGYSPNHPTGTILELPGSRRQYQVHTDGSWRRIRG